jgi:hypothetical protein
MRGNRSEVEMAGSGGHFCGKTATWTRPFLLPSHQIRFFVSGTTSKNC